MKAYVEIITSSRWENGSGWSYSDTYAINAYDKIIKQEEYEWDWVDPAPYSEDDSVDTRWNVKIYEVENIEDLLGDHGYRELLAHGYAAEADIDVEEVEEIGKLILESSIWESDLWKSRNGEEDED